VLWENLMAFGAHVRHRRRNRVGRRGLGSHRQGRL